MKTAQTLPDIFVDTSVLKALYSASRLDVLWQAYAGRLVVPEIVMEELQGRNLNLPFGQRKSTKVAKPVWEQLALEVEQTKKERILRCDRLTDVEDTLALRLAATTMHSGEAAVYAMAFVRGGICCSNDMSALRLKCAQNSVPLLGVFGILHHAFCHNLLTSSEADAAISRMLANGIQIPKVCFADVRNWFEKNSGVELYG